MKTITIHDMDDGLVSLLRTKAREQGLSMDKVIKQILKDALSVRSDIQAPRKDDFLDLFGVWSKEETREFENAVKDFEIIHPEDWH